MSSDIKECVIRTLTQYFVDLEDQMPHQVYDMVLKCVEHPMLEVVMRQADGNQTVAAQILGINRNTLRRKLIEHNLI